ncbi:KAP family P-loop NTPase fold protein [Stenotrophomonas lactitubi]|uniref:KAP family P-loop NTPase fold protein n=1 Tax=Stenotrophomonas lactitubi TaxID=2045214 RepID=UPI003209F5CD
MQLRAPVIEVPAESPFENDKLGRKLAVETLADILKSTVDPLVISVNAPWGYGKSTFLQMLTAHLAKHSVKTISFNAWESDYVDDPFVALLGDTEEQLKALKSHRGLSIQVKIERVKRLGVKIISAALPAAVKIGTAGIIDLQEVTEAAIADAAEQFTKNQIDAYSEAKRSIASFRNELGEIASTIYREDSQLPLVFIIDELDRCRPTHAVRLLEIVKHFFSIERVAFVIALDPDQLGHSVRTLYGQGMDVDGYLKRFFDLELNLPDPKAGAFLDAQFERFGLAEFFAGRSGHHETRYDRERIEIMFGELFPALSFSFREQERAFALLSLAIRATQQDQYLRPFLLGCLILLKIKNSKLYRDFVAGRGAAADVIGYFSKAGAKGMAFTQSHYGYALEGELIAVQTPIHEQADLYNRFEQELGDGELTPQARSRATTIHHVLKEVRFGRRSVNIASIASKIDLISGRD